MALSRSGLFLLTSLDTGTVTVGVTLWAAASRSESHSQLRRILESGLTCPRAAVTNEDLHYSKYVTARLDSRIPSRSAPPKNRPGTHPVTESCHGTPIIPIPSLDARPGAVQRCGQSPVCGPVSSTPVRTAGCQHTQKFYFPNLPLAVDRICTGRIRVGFGDSNPSRKLASEP